MNAASRPLRSAEASLRYASLPSSVTPPYTQWKLKKTAMQTRQSGPGLKPCSVSKSDGTWALSNDGTLLPSNDYTHRLNFWLFSRQQDDLLVPFKFAAEFETPPSFVHHSRLSWAGGALYSSFRSGLNKGTDGEVALQPSDSPATFAVMKEFLYAMPVRLASLPLGQLVQVAQSARHWQLSELFHGSCLCLAQGDRITAAEDLLAATKIAAIPEVPEEFRLYFWDRVGKFFDSLLETKGGVGCNTSTDAAHGIQSRPDVTSGERRSCPRFPELWSLALAQGMVHNALEAILRYSNGALRDLLFDVVLLDLEPRIRNEQMLFDILRQIGSTREEDKRKFMEKWAERNISERAVRLLSRSMTTESNKTHAVRHSWHCNWTKSLQAFVCGEEFSKKVRLSPRDLSYPVDDSESPCTAYDILYKNSLGVTLSKSRNRTKNVILRVEWVTGAQFMAYSQRIDITVRVSEGECVCGGTHKSLHERNECLGEVSMTETLGADGWVILCIERERLKKIRGAHTDPYFCRVSITLDASVAQW